MQCDPSIWSLSLYSWVFSFQILVREICANDRAHYSESVHAVIVLFWIRIFRNFSAIICFCLRARCFQFYHTLFSTFPCKWKFSFYQEYHATSMDSSRRAFLGRSIYGQLMSAMLNTLTEKKCIPDLIARRAVWVWDTLVCTGMRRILSCFVSIVNFN